MPSVRMVRDVDVNDPSAVVQQHDEDQQRANREDRVRDREEIDRRQRQDVIRHTGAPRL